MKESVIYQAILGGGFAEGLEERRTEEARRIVVLLGTDRFGQPSPQACRFPARVINRKIFDEIDQSHLQNGQLG